MRAADFDFSLPPELIAQSPAAERDQSRLLVLDRASGQISHRHFPAILEQLREGDVLVLNDSRVIPARLRGLNVRTGGQFEVLLLAQYAVNDWWVMLRPGRRARLGTQIRFNIGSGEPSAVQATVTETNAEGHRRLRFTGCDNVLNELDRMGEVPLPPYIRRADQENRQLDLERYQTVYAQPAGSVAAPTAGLHFTQSLLSKIRARGVEVCFLTLHVGLGTFAPVKAETLAAHTMHEEYYCLSDETARRINAARTATERRVIAVGTTTVRVLESVAAQNDGQLRPGKGRTNIFIYPPHQFRMVDALLTNFHLPRSTLLMLVSAFAAPGNTHGRDLVLSAYAEAIRHRYRFFSYGDAMLLL